MKLGEVLKNREGRYRPNNPSIAGLKRIDKINFSGQIFLSDKDSNTDMIIVKKGDLIISGINVEKGALAIYDGEDDILATIHYSSYIFDPEKIDIDFLKVFLRSPDFIQLLKEQVPGGIKTEIKPKHILPLFVYFPETIQEQKLVARNFFEKVKKLKILDGYVNSQLSLLESLNQAILQEAVQGKLVPQNPNDEPASELLKRIKAEKTKLAKKEKPLPPIRPEEIPFVIPGNWVWCRLGELTDYGSSPKAEPSDLSNNTWVLDLEDIEKTTSNVISKLRFDERNSLSTKSVFKKGDVLYSKLRPYLDKVIVADEDGVCTTEILPLKCYAYLNPYYLRYALKRADFLKYVNSKTRGMKMPRLGTKEGQLALIPIPPLSEQKLIVSEIERQYAKTKEIKGYILRSQQATEQLLKALLHQAFEVDNKAF